MSILTKLQNLDRRWLYLFVAVAIAGPIIAKPKSHPTTIFPEVRSAYETLQAVPHGKIVIINGYFGPGTLAENGPQYEAIVRQLFRNGTKFVVMNWDPAGAEITYQMTEALQKEMGKKYGVDWVHLGFKTGDQRVIFAGMAEDFARVMKVDKLGTKLSELPATSGVKDYKQIGAVVEVTPSATVGLWVAYFTGPKNIPLIYCPTAVMSAEAYPFLDSGQMKGMLNGVIGAAQYETLVGLENTATDAAASAWALSMAHIAIILLILLGNLGYVLSKRAGLDTGGRRLG